MLADTIEALGESSAFARDWHPHPYPRRLAMSREAIASNPYARGNLELARLLIELGQPEAAVR